MILAEKIALLRRQNGWSQEELADQLKVSRQAVSKWEGGTSIPDLDKILKLSALFEVSTDYLLKDELEQPDATAPLPKEERVTEPCRTVSFDEANAYLSTVRAVHGKMAAGVGLCILSPIALLVLGAWSDGTPSEERMAGLGVIFLLLFVALGLLLILPAAIRLEAFEYLEKEQIALAYGVEGIVERQKQEYAPTYRRSMTQGVVLCVLAVVPILGTAMLGAPGFWIVAAVGLLLAIVAGAVQLFIRAVMTQGSFDKLLQTGEYTVREKWTNRRVGWVAGALCRRCISLSTSGTTTGKTAGSSGPWPGLSSPPSTLPSVRGQTGKIGKAPTNESAEQTTGPAPSHGVDRADGRLGWYTG